MDWVMVSAMEHQGYVVHQLYANGIPTVQQRYTNDTIMVQKRCDTPMKPELNSVPENLLKWINKSNIVQAHVGEF